MKSLLACLTLLLAVSGARADDLADAAKAAEAKSYDVAMRLYTKQANAGNPVAQFKLGEMYWYGEGTPADVATASEWFRKSAAAGNAEAAAALGVIKQREVRAADIAYWTGKYDGAELKSAGAACKAPVIPAVSKKNDEIKEISTAVAGWQACYNGFIDKMASVLPAGKGIPADVSTLMNEQEYTLATARLDKVYAGISAGEAARAKVTLDAYERWVAATEAYAKEHNQVVAARKEAEKRDIDAMQRQFERTGLTTQSPSSLQRK